MTVALQRYGHCYGVRAHVRPVGYRQLGTFLDQTPPEAPSAFDPLRGACPFQMLGNGPDPTLTIPGGPRGDCGFVMTVNDCLIDAAETVEPFTMPSANLVVTSYLKYNHGVDRGVVNAQLFAYWHRFGLPWGGRLVGAAGVNHNDFDEAMAYVHAFGGACMAITVTEAMEEQTARGEPWDLTGTAADTNVLGGHDVFVFAREDADTGVLATWGQRQRFTRRWFQRFVMELDATITEEQAERRGSGLGTDIEQLEAYMDGLDVLVA